MRKVGVVGLGSIGRRHARLLAARPDIELHVMDLSEAGRDLARTECKAAIATEYDRFDALLDAGMDAVVIATPHHLHVEQARRALAAGCHVLCEKPVSHTVEEVDALSADPNRAGKVLSFGFHLHFHPALLRLKAIIDSGEFGDLLHLGCHVGSYQTLQFSQSRYQKDLFGALLLDYVHQPDLIFWLSGKRPKSVFASGLRGGHRELSSDPDLVSILYDFGDSFSAHIHQNYLEQPEVHSYQAIFAAGSVQIDMIAGRLRIHDGAAIREETVMVDRDAVYAQEHQTFFDAIDGKGAAESPLPEALLSLGAQQAALTSLVEKRPVALSEFGIAGEDAGA